MYARPRPFMVFDNLHAFRCIPDFGAPSGHLFSFTVAYISLFHMYINPWIYRKTHKKGILPQSRTDIVNNSNDNVAIATDDDIKSENYRLTPLIFLAWVLCICILAAIGLTRIYMAYHSFDQIILGFVYGAAMAIWIFILFDEWWGRFLRRLAEKPSKQFMVKAFVGVSIAFVICLVVPIIIYEVQKQKIVYSESWVRNLARKCGITNPNAMLAYDFAHSGVIMCLFGILSALLITKGYYLRSYSYEKIGFGRELGRIVNYIVVVAIPVLIMRFVPWEDVSSPYLNYFVGHCLMYFLVGYGLFGLIPFLFKWCRLDKTGDLLRQRKPVVRSGVEKEVQNEKANGEKNVLGSNIGQHVLAMM